MKQIQLLMSQIQRSDGLSPFENSYLCFIAVKFPDGTYLELDLRVVHSRPSEVVQAVLSLLSNYSDSPLKPLEGLLEENLTRLNVTTCVVKLHRSWSLGESDVVH